MKLYSYTVIVSKFGMEASGAAYESTNSSKHDSFKKRQLAKGNQFYGLFTRRGRVEFDQQRQIESLMKWNSEHLHTKPAFRPLSHAAFVTTLTLIFCNCSLSDLEATRDELLFEVHKMSLEEEGPKPDKSVRKFDVIKTFLPY